MNTRRPDLRRWTILLSLAIALPALAAQPLPAPLPASARVAAVQVRVTPDSRDWTYAPGAPVKFTIIVTADNEPMPGATVHYQIGPEMMPAEEKTAAAGVGGALVVQGGTLRQPGFLRCIATVEYGGRTFRGLATAGFAPGSITPTQTDPPDFDAFWAAQKAELARLPLDPRLTPLPDLGTATVDTFQLNLQNVGDRFGPSRFYGILCVPRGAGPFPALLVVPGAGVRAYRGRMDYAERGFITLQVGIHGIPVNLPPEVYDSLYAGALANYNVSVLVSREHYYYRRAYLGCIRAVDYLASHPKWDGRHLLVMGGSQGGQLTIATAALDPRVTAVAANYPAYCDVTGYLHDRAGGWPHMFCDASAGYLTPEQIATTAYYDTVNFARRLRVPGFYMWGYNDETCPPTSTFAAYNVIAAPKMLCLALEQGHRESPEFTETPRPWILRQAGLGPDLSPSPMVTH